MQHNWIKTEIEQLQAEGLLRQLRINDPTCLNFSTNDYLNLRNHPVVIETAIKHLEKYGAGAAASRLMSGNLTCHEELEQQMANFKGYPAALVYGSGFLANCGIITTLVGRGDTIFADRLAHASLIDASILSRAKLKRFKHNDVEHLASLLKKTPFSGRRLIVTESVFSMDGDIAPLEKINELAEEYHALLLVDEAHSAGIFGPNGSGLIKQLGLQEKITVSMTTLSKGLGSYGGVVACNADFKQLLINRSRSFIYSTALPPVSVGAALGALAVLYQNPNIGKMLLEKAEYFRTELKRAGFETGITQSQIIPVIIGDNRKALEFSNRLREKGIIVVAIRPPTVPKGTARIRFSLTREHSKKDLDYTVKSLSEVTKDLSL